MSHMFFDVTHAEIKWSDSSSPFRFSLFTISMNLPGTPGDDCPVHVQTDITPQPRLPKHRNVEDCAVSLRWFINFAMTTFRANNESSNSDPDGFTSGDVVNQIVMPKTLHSHCRYVDQLDDKFVGKVQYFISHAWKCKIGMLSEGLEKYFKEQLISDPGWDVFVWIDMFAIKQHPTTREMDDLENLDVNLVTVIKAAESTLIVLDYGMEPFTRIW